MFSEEDFPKRLAELRTKKCVSARDMSLSIGQGAGYINNIENGNNLPSMTAFFYICEYLGISPSEFFDIDNRNPGKLDELYDKMKGFKQEKLEAIEAIIEQMK